MADDLVLDATVVAQGWRPRMLAESGRFTAGAVFENRTFSSASLPVQHTAV